MACSRFLCFLVKGFTGIFPDLVRDSSQGLFLKACLSFRDWPINLLARWIIDVARSVSGSLLSTSDLSLAVWLTWGILSGWMKLSSVSIWTGSWSEDANLTSEDNFLISDGTWFASNRIRKLSICVASPPASPMTEAIHQTLCATKIYWCCLA